MKGVKLMKTIEITSYEPIHDEKGSRRKITKRIETFNDNEVRDNDFCTLCRSPIFPECTKTCPYREAAMKYGRK